MKRILNRLVEFPVLRWLRYAALCVLAGFMTYLATTLTAWREDKNFIVFAIPVSFVVNAVSIEILFSILRKR